MNAICVGPLRHATASRATSPAKAGEEEIAVLCPRYRVDAGLW
jgi:hypothetical protein